MASAGSTDTTATTDAAETLTSLAATAETSDTTDALAPVDVLQVSGLFDEVMVNAVTAAIDRAEGGDSQALVLQLNTGGAVVSDDMMRDLLVRVRDADVAIGIWVGPSGNARAYGAPAQLFGVADVTAMVAGSRLGYTGELLDPSVDLGPAADQLRNGSMSFAEARSLDVLRLATTDEGVPTVRSMVLAMDGAELADGTVLDTITQELDDEGNTQNVSTLVRFSGLGVTDELFPPWPARRSRTCSSSSACAC
jgi:membrane-bound ClpP family serine protease